ncbi:MAG: hypothetical protein PHT94_04640 [Candidatus Nanoarchaeia archaeon]|nr:hypothetical protein [Candidatus Nanoarchaeia archaeon]
MTKYLFNNKDKNNSELIGQTFENYCYNYASTERIFIDKKQTRIEKDIREIFNQYTSHLTINHDIIYIEDVFKNITTELRKIIPYFDEPLSTTDFYSRQTKRKIEKYYNFMQYSTPTLSELVQKEMLLCSGENLLFLKSIPNNGFKIYHELSEKRYRKTHSLIGLEINEYSLIIDLSENIVNIKEKERLKENFLEAIIN